MEEAWLMGAGLSSLVTGSFEEDASLTAEALLSTLTRQQAATVKNRLDNYNETLRKKNRQPVKDVRDIFTQVRESNKIKKKIEEEEKGKNKNNDFKFFGSVQG